MKEKQIFGATDGIRAKANEYPLDVVTLVKIGQALAEFTKRNTPKSAIRKPKVIIGKDTRRSGYMLEQAITAGLLSRGVDVMQIGPSPTPSISHLVKSFALDLGIMLTASHNPFTDNGIKVFTENGKKITDENELEIEDLFFKFDFTSSSEIGKAKRIKNSDGRYIEFIKSVVGNPSLKDFKIVIDCANGAAYNIAPTIFKELGAEVIEIGVTPNGFNINKDVGSLHPETVAKAVIKHKAHLGIALDGDADRVIFVDEKGHIIDGDYIMALLAIELKENNKLNKNTIVVTQYSNIALTNYLTKLGIKVDKVINGDRAVSALCQEKGYNFGGEFNGHFIFLDYADAGDGTMMALEVMRILKEKGQSLSSLAYKFEKFPQKISNVITKDKPELSEIKEIQELLNKWTNTLGDNGRVFLRYSGTENLLRIMVESKDSSLLETISQEFVEVVTKVLA